jgi:hypothetical protein
MMRHNEDHVSPAPFRKARRIRHPGGEGYMDRYYYLLRGPLGAWRAMCDADDMWWPDDPDFWWPDGRAWCVRADILLDSAYVAGSAACIGDVIAADGLEVMATKAEDPAQYWMDIINDPYGAVPRSY